MIEVQVIDDKLLLEGICEAESYVNEKVAAQLKTKNLVEVSPGAEALVLSFKRIGKVENVIGFDKITKLCLIFLQSVSPTAQARHGRESACCSNACGLRQATRLPPMFAVVSRNRPHRRPWQHLRGGCHTQRP